MNDLRILREKIVELDIELLQMINKRGDIAKKWKRENKVRD